MSVRDITHAAMQWHAVYAKRMALNAERLKLSKDWPETGGNFSAPHPVITRYWAVKNEITAVKAKERAALKVLAKACAQQRHELASTEVIDVDVRLLDQQQDAP